MFFVIASEGGGGMHVSNSHGEPPGPPMPRPILPRERGMLDRFVEYLVGDGPSNRYALVCRQCESHNGMALKDEFPYIGTLFCKRISRILREELYFIVFNMKSGFKDLMTILFYSFVFFLIINLN